MIMSNFGNRHMEETGIHYMTTKTADEQVTVDCTDNCKDDQKSADMLLKGFSDEDDLDIAATGYTIIFKPYKKNPHRKMKKSASGLIITDDIFAGIGKSQDSGENEESEPFIQCGRAISVGPECKYVKVGEDFYFRNSKVPVPFNNLGYFAISENNVICRIIKK
jgi:hypothetical protein